MPIESTSKEIFGEFLVGLRCFLWNPSWKHLRGDFGGIFSGFEGFLWLLSAVPQGVFSHPAAKPSSAPKSLGIPGISGAGRGLLAPAESLHPVGILLLLGRSPPAPALEEPELWGGKRNKIPLLFQELFMG